MARIFLDKNNEFTVKEWKTANIIIGVVFAALFIFALYNLGLDNWKSIGLFLCLGLLIGGMVFRYGKRSTAQSLILRVNNAGIYYYGKFITGWDNFYNAYVTNDVVIGSYSDNFELVIEFYREDQLIRKKIPLTNTQDKSEEEVYAAVMYFYKQHNSANIETVDTNAEVIK